jgi:hypothetical protein
MFAKEIPTPTTKTAGEHSQFALQADDVFAALYRALEAAHDMDEEEDFERDRGCSIPQLDPAQTRPQPSQRRDGGSATQNYLVPPTRYSQDGSGDVL